MINCDAKENKVHPGRSDKKSVYMSCIGFGKHLLAVRQLLWKTSQNMYIDNISTAKSPEQSPQILYNFP